MMNNGCTTRDITILLSRRSSPPFFPPLSTFHQPHSLICWDTRPTSTWSAYWLKWQMLDVIWPIYKTSAKMGCVRWKWIDIVDIAAQNQQHHIFQDFQDLGSPFCCRGKSTDPKSSSKFQASSFQEPYRAPFHSGVIHTCHLWITGVAYGWHHCSLQQALF